MNVVHRITIQLIVVAFLVTGLLPDSSAVSGAPTVEFASLLDDPARFHGKTVRIRALWVVGEEWSRLHFVADRPLACIWLETADDEESRTAPAVARRIERGNGGILGVVVEGVFLNQPGGHIGGGCPYLFVAGRFLEARPLVQGTLAPDRMSPKDLQRLTEWCAGRSGRAG